MICRTNTCFVHTFVIRFVSRVHGTCLINMAALLVLLLICCVSSTPQRKTELLNKLLSAVEKAADFFSSDYANINADGIFGLRIGQGQLIQIFEDCNQRHCDEKALSRIRRITSIVEETCKSAMPYLKQLDEKYYNRFFPLMKEPYLLKYRPHTFRNLDKVKPGTNTEYNEEDGDSCFARIMGTYVDEKGEYLPKCNTTQRCFDMMTHEGTAEYTITHQLFYFIIMEHTDCDKMAGGVITADNLRRVEQKLCKIIYKEAETLWNGQDVFLGHQDLFMEQGVLCGILGFENFMRTDWVRAVLRWQTHEGCFKAKRPWQIFEEMIMPHGDVETSKTPMRRLQRETSMSGDCLAHKSGLGFGYLSTFLRYFIRSSY
ncbi:UPF0764 protein C16orf89 homolog [Gigantopelta aegis]|uniref:UPF0764 protein C16orf89 homolog n=1 Tax=Gigantopelta aegis TaxID=1735272 RepID=UPI001B88B43F|nr:UPF0764 protein C16orf89 homolog [Gigantopelta aegis]